MNLDPKLVAKYKLAGLSDKVVAAKLGVEPAEIAAAWAQILAVSQTVNQAVGYHAMIANFEVLCHQYQLLGESLKKVALALGNPMRAEEIRVLVTDNKEETIANLLMAGIILRGIPVDSIGTEIEKALGRKAQEN